ncbi:MAG: polysaccharide deacetylase family protein [Gemmatimonadota bacterium]
MNGWWLAGAGLGAAATAAWGVYDPDSPLYGRVIHRGSSPDGAGDIAAPPTVYLTFDDGPNPAATDKILETLSVADAPATFFVVGSHVRRFPETARRIAGAGHELGNHTDTHVKLHVRGPGRISRELRACHAAIQQITGQPVRSFRAPHGYRSPFVGPAARRLGYAVFGWSFGVWDTAQPGAEEIRRRVRTKLRPGSIVLLHDGDGYNPLGDRRQTAEALPGIIRDARDAGYVLRPTAELLPR